MEIDDLLIIILMALPIIVSVIAYQNSRSVRDREEKFEEELERKQKNWQIETMHFPTLILNFRRDMERFIQDMNSHAGAPNHFIELQNRIENSEIQFIKPIDEPLKTSLEKIHEIIIPRMKEYDQLKMRIFGKTLDLWIEHLLDRDLYKHGNFSEPTVARRALMKSLEEIINGDQKSVSRNFTHELEVELSASPSYFDPYNPETQGSLSDMAIAEYEPVRKLQEKILEDFTCVEKIIERMEEIMAA